MNDKPINLDHHDTQFHESALIQIDCVSTDDHDK